MQKLIIKGNRRTYGETVVQGAKNSVLPILAGCVLARGETVIHNCPVLSDVFASIRIINHLGGKCSFTGNTAVVNCSEITKTTVPDELMREMRSSIIFMGAILGRTGECELSFPGGCELGPRPIDMHISALKQMGVKIREEYGSILCSCPHGLSGTKINLSFPSVGATENVMLAACTARGETVIENAAREPEICDLGEFLKRCGAKIKGCGTGTIIVEGVKELKGCEYTVMPDRIAAATFMCAAASTGGEVNICGGRCCDLQAIIPVFEQMGCTVYGGQNNIFISCGKPLKAVGTIRTMPYPGFPTDAQAIVMAVLARARGTSVMIENIFESRYRHVDELVRMGADIKAVGKAAIIRGVKNLYGAKVRATDLRGGAALVVAAMGAEGETELSNIKFIDRGYENIEKSLDDIGADIKRVNC